jgi:hypothetical protein|tara:strand:- start:4973 stop:5545 length:573 start_codon:yes stop_codon:yes gene_type:complete
MTLGIDVSTSITGFAVVADGQLLHYSSIDLRKYKSIFEKANVLREYLLDIYENYQLDQSDADFRFGESNYPIDNIYIEQPFTFFNSGGSSAKTMATLQRFNGMVSWIVYELFSMAPEYVLATQARKHCGLKIPRGQKAKEVVLKHLLETEPAFKIEYTSYGNPKPESYDRADAIIVARAGDIIEKQVDTE